MARTLKLVRSGSSDLSFLAAASSGFRVQKWAPAQAPISYRGIPAYVTEELDCLVDRDSDDNLATTLQALEDYAAYAEMFWHDRTIYTPVWFHAKMDGATYTRRALVKAIHFGWRSDPIANSGHAVKHNAVLRVQIERHPYWESLNEFQAASDNLQGASVLYDPSDTTDGVVVGTVPARPRLETKAWQEMPNPPSEVDRVWMGIRSEKHGDPTNFLLIWECEDGTLGTDAALAADVSASPTGAGNTKVEVDFTTTADWAKRLDLVLEDLTANPEDQAGRFLELLRAKVDASTECEVRVKIGIEDSPDATFFAIGSDVEITNTDWDFYAVGDAVIPVINGQSGSFAALAPDDYPDKTEIQIWARRTSGSGSLHLDCLCPVPIDEGYAILSYQGVGDLVEPNHYYLTERDESVAWSTTAGPVERSVIVSDHNFRLPPGETRLVVVYAQEGLSTLDDWIYLDCDFFPRWASLRGGEGYRA